MYAGSINAHFDSSIDAVERVVDPAAYTVFVQRILTATDQVTFRKKGKRIQRDGGLDWLSYIPLSRIRTSGKPPMFTKQQLSRRLNATGLTHASPPSLTLLETGFKFYVEISVQKSGRVRKGL